MADPHTESYSSLECRALEDLSIVIKRKGRPITESARFKESKIIGKKAVKKSNALPVPRPPADLNAITERNMKESPFLRLPGELRNRIYHHVFEGVRVRIYHHGHSRIFMLLNFNTKILNFLYVCRTVFSEARLFPFALGCFHFEYRRDDPIVERMARTFRLLPEQVNSIKTIAVSHLLPSLREYFWEDIPRLPALKRIIVRPSYGSDHGKARVWKEFDQRTAIAIQEHLGTSVRVEYVGDELEGWEKEYAT